MVDPGNAPRAIQIVGRHVFFWIPTGGHDQLFDYDFAKATKRRVELPGASKWQYEGIDGIHTATEKKNALHFCYSLGGQRVEDGRDYRTGYYELNVTNGIITWIGDLDPDFHIFRAADGRYIGFEGEDVSEGHKLVSSAFNQFRFESRDPKGKMTKVLKNFSRFRTLMGGTYSLEQMSPCRRYALVRLEEPTVATKKGSPGWVRTYFIVNAGTGETTVLAKEEVRKKIVGFASEFYWVGPPPE